MARFRIGAVQVGDTVFPNVLPDATVGPGIEAMEAQGTGVHTRGFLAILGQHPIVAFRTMGVATALGTCALACLKIDSSTKLALWLKSRADGTFFASGAGHTKIEIDDGMLVPRLIASDYRSFVSIGYELLVVERTGDGSSPITITENQSLPDGAFAEEFFTLGPIVLNGTKLSTIQSMGFDPGIQTETRGGSGSIYDHFAAATRIMPVLTARSEDDVVLHSTITDQGVAISSNCIAYLPRCTKAGRLVGGSTDISLTLAPGLADITEVGDGTIDWQVRPTAETVADLTSFSLTATTP